MHELSIAQAVLGIVLRHADDRPVVKVELDVGHLRQVVPDALAFAWTLVAEGTPAERSELELREIPAAGRCRSCGMDTEWDGLPLVCGACGGFDVEVTRGEELRVQALELDDEPAMAT